MYMYGLNLLKGFTPMSSKFVMFHDLILVVLLFMLILTGGGMFYIYSKKFISNKFVELNWLEMVWTVIPGIMLFFLALPSLKLLYFVDMSLDVNPGGTMKVLGYQWYWKYGYGGFSNDGFDTLSYDSYMVSYNDLKQGDFRLLEVDLPMMMPSGCFTRFLVGAGDVIHSFTVKGLGLKVDAVPGRLNCGYVCSDLLGVFYGQCSEICGVNHAFMPICVELVEMC